MGEQHPEVVRKHYIDAALSTSNLLTFKCVNSVLVVSCLGLHPTQRRHARDCGNFALGGDRNNSLNKERQIN